MGDEKQDHLVELVTQLKNEQDRTKRLMDRMQQADRILRLYNMDGTTSISGSTTTCPPRSMLPPSSSASPAATIDASPPLVASTTSLKITNDEIDVLVTRSRTYRRFSACQSLSKSLKKNSIA